MRVASKNRHRFLRGEHAEAALLREMARSSRCRARCHERGGSAATLGLGAGNPCISVGHKSQITQALLRALHASGVRYISTRSVGYNHIDVHLAEALGISVGNVAYSPDSVADYTLMLILMAARSAKSTIIRTQALDYRLSDTPGRELRDMTDRDRRYGPYRRCGARTSPGLWLPHPGVRPSSRTHCRLCTPRRLAASQRCRDAPHAAHHGDPPSPGPSTHRADEARRLCRQHGTGIASRDGGSCPRPGRRPAGRSGPRCPRG